MRVGLELARTNSPPTFAAAHRYRERDGETRAAARAMTRGRCPPYKPLCSFHPSDALRRPQIRT